MTGELLNRLTNYNVDVIIIHSTVKGTQRLAKQNRFT